MKRAAGTYVRSQDGFTLIEVVIASALGAMLMTALTSVLLTSVRAANIATSRIEASGQIRNFEFFAYDDFARSSIPVSTPCAPPSVACIDLTGTQMSNSTTPTPTYNYTVEYSWDGSSFLDRKVGGIVTHMATNASSFSWYVDGTTAHPTVVVSLTVTIGNLSSFSGSYSQSQTWKFEPRVNNP